MSRGVWVALLAWAAGYLLTSSLYVREQATREAYRARHPSWAGFLFQVLPRVAMLGLVWPFILGAYFFFRRRRRPPT